MVGEFFTLGDCGDWQFTIRKVKQQGACKGCVTRYCCADVWFVVYWVYQTIERPKKKLTKAGRKYHKPFSNDQAMTGCIPQTLMQLFTSFFYRCLLFFTTFFYTVVLQLFTVFLQFFFLQFFTFFTVFYKAVEWAGDFGAGDLGGSGRNLISSNALQPPQTIPHAPPILLMVHRV